MNAGLHELVVRRDVLVADAASQRDRLRGEVRRWRAPLVLVDHGFTALRLLRAHSNWILGGIVILAVLRPGALGLWLQRAWLVTRFVRRLPIG